MVEWSIYDANGEEFVMQTYAYYVPSADIRLFSPQAFMQEQPLSDDITRAIIRRDGIHFHLRQCDDQEFFFPYHPKNNIPYMLPTSGRDDQQETLLTVDDYEVSLNFRQMEFFTEEMAALCHDEEYASAPIRTYRHLRRLSSYITGDVAMLGSIGYSH